MLTLGISIHQDQWRDADWQVQAMQQNKDADQVGAALLQTLYQNALIDDEIQNLNFAKNAMQTRTGANIAGAVGGSIPHHPGQLRGSTLDIRPGSNRVRNWPGCSTPSPKSC